MDLRRDAIVICLAVIATAAVLFAIQMWSDVRSLKTLQSEVETYKRTTDQVVNFLNTTIQANQAAQTKK